MNRQKWLSVFFFLLFFVFTFEVGLSSFSGSLQVWWSVSPFSIHAVVPLEFSDLYCFKYLPVASQCNSIWSKRQAHRAKIPWQKAKWILESSEPQRENPPVMVSVQFVSEGFEGLSLFGMITYVQKMLANHLQLVLRTERDQLCKHLICRRNSIQCIIMNSSGKTRFQLSSIAQWH